MTRDQMTICADSGFYRATDGAFLLRSYSEKGLIALNNLLWTRYVQGDFALIEDRP
jgi:hypothetical protein